MEHWLPNAPFQAEIAGSLAMTIFCTMIAIWWRRYGRYFTFAFAWTRGRGNGVVRLIVASAAVSFAYGFVELIVTRTPAPSDWVPALGLALLSVVMWVVLEAVVRWMTS